MQIVVLVPIRIKDCCYFCDLDSEIVDILFWWKQYSFKIVLILCSSVESYVEDLKPQHVSKQPIDPFLLLFAVA